MSRRAARWAGRSAAVGASVSGVVAPCGMTSIFGGVDVEALDQSDAGALGHHDDGVGERRTPARARTAGSASGWRPRCGRPRSTARRWRPARRAPRRRRGRRRCRTRAGRSPRRCDRARRRRRRRGPARRRRATPAPAGPPSPGVTPQRTTSTVPPLATRPAASAAENVAMPHAVGGKVDRMPNDRAGPSTAGTAGIDGGEGTHDELLTSARSRRRACEGRRSRDGRPAQARRLSQEV